MDGVPRLRSDKGERERDPWESVAHLSKSSGGHGNFQQCHFTHSSDKTIHSEDNLVAETRKFCIHLILSPWALQINIHNRNVWQEIWSSGREGLKKVER